MEIENLTHVLSTHPFLSGLDPRQIEEIVSCAKNQRFGEGEFMCREGEQADVFYLIRAGKVALELRVPPQGGLRIETLDEGDVLGWSWLVAPYVWHFDARVVHPVRAIVLDGKCLRNKCEEDHELGFQLLKRFSSLIEQRLQSTRLQLLDVYGMPKEAHIRVRH